MTEGFYLPLDSFFKPTPKTADTMATTHAPGHDAISTNKHPHIDVSVAEIDADSPSTEYDRLSVLQSPRMYPKPGGFIPHQPHFPHGPHEPHHGGHLRPSSPTGSVRSSFGSTRRRSSRHTSYSGGFSRSHYSEVSKELTIQAESEFVALMELMSSMSRRSSSLKEVWMRIISERESHCHEMDRMYEQIDEYTETIERHERESHSHGHEHEERRKEIVKLRLELTAAIALSAEWKRKHSDRECELGEARNEISELKDKYKYSLERHEETKTTLEETEISLIAMTDACHHAEDDARKHEGELDILQTRYTELEASFTKISSKLKSVSSEVSTLRISNSTYKKESEEWLHEKGRLEDENRKCRESHEASKRTIKDITELFEKKKHELTETIEKSKREVREVTETLTKIKYEREELHQKYELKERELEETRGKYNECQDRCSKYKLKYEHCSREITTLKEEVTSLKSEKIEFEETVTKLTEEHSRVSIELKQLRKEHHGKCKESDDRHRDIIVLKQKIIHHETTIKEKTEIIHSHSERIERITRDYEEARDRHEESKTELATKIAAIITLNLTIDTLTSERNSYCEKFREYECKYEEIYRSHQEYHESGSGFEYEVERLRELLREVRDEREKAIQLRGTADRERDQATRKYEQKCREMDKMEEDFRRHKDHDRFHGRTVPDHPVYGRPVHDIPRLPRQGPVRILSRSNSMVAGEGDESASVARSEVAETS